MHFIGKYLSLGLIAAVSVAWGIVPVLTPLTAQASATCGVVQSLSADIPAVNGLNNGTEVIAAFNHARQAEGCTAPLSISASAFDSAGPQQQMLMLFNAERADRGLSTFQLDSTLLSQIDLNHSREMAQYKYFNHPSPINHPGWNYVFDRDTVNLAIAGHWTYLGENIAAGYTVGGAVYAYMYTDSGSQWGHRHNILGGFNWVGIGVYQGGPYGVYYSSDFLNGPYSPPAAADTTPPVLSAPAIVSGSQGGTVTARVTGVSDSGASAGEAGVTGVVFSAGVASQDSQGNANTVSATQSSPGVWTATLSLAAGSTLHAVAVDGSGNFTDCASNSTSCTGGVTNPPPAASISLSRVSGVTGSQVTVTGSGFTPGETVGISWDGSSLTSTTADSAGNISRSVSVPPSPYGAHMVKATGQSSGAAAQATFSVVPRATLSRTSGIHGTLVYTTGYGFQAGESVTVHLSSPSGSQLGGTGHASSTGTTGRFSFNVPTVPTGKYTLYLVGASSHASAAVSFTVTG